jgi:hypothetical protein
LEKSFAAQNVAQNKFSFRFATFSELRRFYADVAFIIVIVDFHKMETARFNITCQLISLFTITEKSKFCPLYHSLIVTLEYFFCAFLLVRWGHARLVTGTCPNLITALQLSVRPQTRSAEPPSNDHNNTKRHQRRKFVTRKRWRIWEKKSHFFQQMISPTTS